jgi:hypothetical protein
MRFFRVSRHYKHWDMKVVVIALSYILKSQTYESNQVLTERIQILWIVPKSPLRTSAYTKLDRNKSGVGPRMKISPRLSAVVSPGPTEYIGISSRSPGIFEIFQDSKRSPTETHSYLTTF